MKTYLFNYRRGIAVVILALAAAFILTSCGGGGGSTEREVTLIGEGASALVEYFNPDEDIEILLNQDTPDGAPEDIAEEAEYNIGMEVDANPENWRVRDMQGNIVEAEVIRDGDRLTVKAPEGGYEPGGIYVLDIGYDARFSGEGLGNSRHMVFGVGRGQSEVAELQKNVYNMTEEEADYYEQEGTISIEGGYKEGDILIIDIDDDRLPEAIKLTDVVIEGNRTSALMADADIEEVFSELDIFTVKEFDFSDMEFSDDAMVEDIEEEGILEKLFTPVFAADEPELSLEVKRYRETSEKEHDGKVGTAKAINAELKLKGTGKDEGLALKLAMNMKSDVLMVLNFDELYLDITLDNRGTVEVEKELKKGSLKGEKDILTDLVSKYQQDTGGEKALIEVNKEIGTVTIWIGIIPIIIDVDAEAKLDASAKLRSDMEVGITASPRLWYSFETWSSVEGGTGIDFKKQFSEEFELSGKVDFFAGINFHPFIGIPGQIEAGVNVAAGPYAEVNGRAALKLDCGDEAKKPIDLTGSIKAGLGAKLSGDIAVEYKDTSAGLFSKKTVKNTLWEFLDKKIPLKSIDTGAILNGVNIKESYSIIDGKVSIGELAATYLDIFSQDETEEAIIDYKLYVDGKEAEDPANITGNLASAGEHTIKVSWKRNDEAQEYEGKSTFLESGVVWIMEPTKKYSSIGQLEISRGRFASASNGEYADEYGSAIWNKKGYPQQWVKGIVPAEHSESGEEESITYSPDAFAFNRGSYGAPWGIMDYSGNILLEPIASPIAQSAFPFRLDQQFQGIGWITQDSGNSDGVNHILSADYSGELFSQGYYSGGGTLHSYYGVVDGKLYRFEQSYPTANIEEVEAPEEIRDSLVNIAKDTESIMGWAEDYAYINADGSIVNQEAFYIKNYVNGYYVGLPERTEPDYDDIENADLLIGASYTATPISPAQKFAIVSASSGKPITEYAYEDALYFEEGYCPVKRDGKWGFIDSSGKEVTEMIFDTVTTAYEGKVAAMYDGSLSIFDLNKTIGGGKLTLDVWEAAYDTALKKAAEELANRKSDMKFPEDYSGSYINASGVGAWSAGIELYKDGTFKFNYHDTNMGEIGEGNPNGTVYTASGYGKFGKGKETAYNTYEVMIESFTQDGVPGEEEIRDGVKYVTADYMDGMVPKDIGYIFMGPGAGTENMTEEQAWWFTIMGDNPLDIGELNVSAILIENRAYIRTGGVMTDAEINDALNSIRGVWREGGEGGSINDDSLYYGFNGFNTVLFNQNSGADYESKLSYVEPLEDSGEEGWQANAYNVETNLWSFKVLDQDIKNGVCERIIAVYRSGYNWLEVPLVKDTMSWEELQKLIEDTEPKTGRGDSGMLKRVRVTAEDGGVYLRQGPGVQYTKVIEDMIPTGTELDIMEIEEAENGVTWGRTVYSDGNGAQTGWIALSETEDVV